MQISDKAVEAIRSNNTLMGKLMGAFDRGENTIQNWINADPRDIRLTTPLAVQIIREETGMTDAEILEKKQTAWNKYF